MTNVDDSAGTGTISNTFASGSTVADDYTLVNESGTWKINSQQPRSTPTLTLYTYCDTINKGDYQTAYNQLSSAAQSQESEAQFAANFSSGQLTGCMVNQANDAAGTGTIIYTSSNGYKITGDYTLVNEGGTWKINSQQLRSTPALTLLTYCSALKSGNYPTAYDQLSSSLKSQITEAQFAAAFSANKVTNCTVSNVNDTAGTGTISFTYADGSTGISDFTLIDENSAWKIQKGQARSFIVDHLHTWPLTQNLLGVQTLNKLLPGDAAWVATQHHVEEVREATGSNNVDLISREESYSHAGSCFRPGAYCFFT